MPRSDFTHHVTAEDSYLSEDVEGLKSVSFTFQSEANHFSRAELWMTLGFCL